MPVVLDADAAFVYKAFQEAGRPAYETLTAPEAREFYLQARVVSNPEPPELEKVEPLSIPAPHGAIPARIYTPKTARRKTGLAPCLVFFHGGGWVIGNLETHDVVCRKLAHEGELIVISVDYRAASGLCPDRGRRSLARRRRRIRQAPETGRRCRNLQAFSRPIPRLLHHGQIAAAGQCRGQRHRQLAEGAELEPFPFRLNRNGALDS